ncbi:MAG: hypothetical protein ACRDZ6_08900, partial [Acidimicrobiales bacterium]
MTPSFSATTVLPDDVDAVVCFASEDPGFLDGDPPIDRESARRQGFTGAVGQHCFDVGRPLRL